VRERVEEFFKILAKFKIEIKIQIVGINTRETSGLEKLTYLSIVTD